MRVLEDVAGGEIHSRQGWVPARVLKDQHSGEEDERDKLAHAARRQSVSQSFNFFNFIIQVHIIFTKCRYVLCNQDQQW